MEVWKEIEVKYGSFSAESSHLCLSPPKTIIRITLKKYYLLFLVTLQTFPEHFINVCIQLFGLDCC